MTGMGASLEVEQPSMRRKKSRVQTHGTRGHGAHQIYFVLSIQTPEEEAKIKAKKQLKLDIQVGIDNAHRTLDTE